ncbi:MAG: flavin reductase family protein [Clostridium sp.]|jgi:flavin reductase (DIM6/NTAB) family NADH-FMN oxidoreductase RutF|uniref:flavin reductase family protein n=1 Tax=Clostridium sp. TaxID=1506 RepID=UPI0025C55C75|nr:flavin reductase family protein [Clostridium sp.]MCH3962822.1 flavin reductase family protein [Clostridium sp.]MCI1715763.1 flavin reductase family protein [Clostridium sp.]MCI1800032.1 flavin reductase family protein [Clostridium sp.]MCI1813946.1 flavin reductase family protein [Clostridium sp.]MCI1870844.1 flavin reductase family protein [Clostridium sp.]
MSKINFKGSVMLNPAPVVLVTSKSSSDKLNIFTAAWVSTVCTKDPIIAIGIRPERLSYKYIKETGECVVNLPTKDMVKIVDYCGVISGSREDKIKHFNLNLDKGICVSTPSLEISPVALECRLKSITSLGTHDLFLFKILNVKVDENLLDSNNRICFNKANLICYSHGEYYALNSKPLGTFGFSVRKKKRKK